jgi:hypothetical protein
MTKAMKPIIIVTCLVFFFSVSNKLAHAQVDSNYKKERKLFYYFSPNLSITNKRIMPGIGFTLFTRTGWGISTEVKATIIEAEQMPVDFRPGLVLWGDGMPDDRYVFYTVAITKHFPTRNRRIVPGLQMGIAFTDKNVSTNFKKTVPCTSFNCSWSFDLGSNYDYEIKRTKNTGVFLKPELNYLFSKHIATKLAPWVIVSPKYVFYGVEFSLLLGRIK